MARTDDRRRMRRARAAGVPLLLGASALLVLVALPVVLRGAPLADDFFWCRQTAELGMAGLLGALYDYRGLVRPFRFIETGIVGALCGRVPFGLVMLPGLTATIATGWQLRALLRELGAGPRWAAVGGAVWLLNPVGLESALWPAAMHVPIGLGLAVGALRLVRAGRLGAGTVAALGAMACLEQVIFSLPLLAALVAPPGRRRRVAALAVAAALVLLAVYVAVPGQDPRTTATLADRLTAPLRQLGWYVEFPAIGLGAAAVPGALRWSPVAGGVLLVAGAVAGAALAARAPSWWAGRDVVAPARRRGTWVLAGLVVLALVNLPSIVTVPRDTSPRLFAPTWLALAAAAGLAGDRVRWRRPVFTGGVMGVAAATAVLSLAFAGAVRITHADQSAHAFERLAGLVDDGGLALVCDVPPKLVDPAPAGAFALHDLFYGWAAEPALWYVTGREARIRIGYTGQDCPAAPGADVRLPLAALLEAGG
jgi:hypothetical protein